MNGTDRAAAAMRPSRARRGARRWMAAAAAAAMLAAAACRTEGQADKPAGYGGKPANEVPAAATLFTVAPGQLQHLQLTRVVSAVWPVVVRTTGTVDWDGDHTSPVISQVSGPITHLLVDLGTPVKAGEPLLFVTSPDVTNAISAYRKARNRLDLADRTLKRSKDLLEHHAIAQKDYEQAEADFNDAATEVQSDLQALRIFGVTGQEIQEADRQNQPIRPELAVRSPISGVIVQKLVSPGQIIQAQTTTCFLVSNVSTVWVQGHIYDTDLTAVRVGDTVEETSASLRGTFEGKVSYIGAMLDPATRTTPVRVVTRNRGDLLKKDLFVDLVIHARTERGVLAVPTSAVLYNSDNLPFLYVQVRPGAFAQRLVKTGAQQADQVEILDGLKEGETIVAEGSVFLQFAQTYQQ